MPNPYLVTLTLFAGLGALAAVDAALAALGLTPFLMGLRWLRVHLVTLGLFTEAAFWLLPALVVRRGVSAGRSQGLGRWLLLNVGLVTLLVGIPLVRAPMIAVGGTLVLLAALWLLVELWRQESGAVGDDTAPTAELSTETVGASQVPVGRPFYLAGLLLLLVGAFVGTGLWLGWGEALGISRPKETHIHANLWGFASLVLAGLVVDLRARFGSAQDGQDQPWVRPIFWLMTSGAALLVVAPWTAVDWLMVLGIGLYAVATALLYRTQVWPLGRSGFRAASAVGPDAAGGGASGDLRGPGGSAHLLTAYLWILVPALALPFIVFGGTQVPAARIEPVGPSILSYGWLLQALVALLPPAACLGPAAGSPAPGWEARSLGLSRLTWASLNLCTLTLVASVALPAQEAGLQALAFGLLALALLGFTAQLHRLWPS